MKSLIRLFKAVEITSRRKKKIPKSILERTLKNGYTFSQEVAYNYSVKELEKIADIVEEEIMLSPQQMNSSFHKSWKKVKEADLDQLVIEQLIHYFTTYGFEYFGIYSEDSVYIPNEKLEIPAIDIDGINIIIINGYKKDEIKEKLYNLLKSGIALHQDTIKDVVDVCKYIGVDNVEEIKNKEVKIALCDHLNLVPEVPTEFLRYIIYKKTGNTLLIKNTGTIEQIKLSTVPVVKLFNKYSKNYKLAEIFFRFKPLFLALKSEKDMKPIINRIRKLADKYHKLMPVDYLNEITSMIKNGRGVDTKKLKNALKSVNTFRKIRLAYALKYRTKDTESILYKIRNGKGYATPFNFTKKSVAKRILEIVLNSIIKDIRKNVKGKKIYIPEHIVYSLPATEKQFTGNLPSGTYVTIPKDMIFGVHWNNVNHHRIDLDLSLMNMEIGKIGWDGDYRTGDRGILFSGDVTDAGGENGASELFYIKRQAKEELIMQVNYYNYREDTEVPYDIIVAKEQVKSMEENYMINPNNVIAVARSKINEKQKILGLIVVTTKENRFYFSEISIGSAITSRLNDYTGHSLNYLTSFYRNSISLNSLLEKAGALLVKDKDECDIDLSPESLEKDKIISLLT